MPPEDSHNIGPISGWNMLATVVIIAVVAMSAWLPGCGSDNGGQETTTTPAVTSTGGFDSSVPVSVPIGPAYTVMEE